MKRLSDEQLIDVYKIVQNIKNMDKAFVKLLEEELQERALLLVALNRCHKKEKPLN